MGTKAICLLMIVSLYGCKYLSLGKFEIQN